MSIQDQPAATHSTLRFAPYRDGSGQSALSITMSLKDMAKFYRPHREDLYGGAFTESWSSVWNSEYLPFRIRNEQDAMRAMNEGQFPETLRAEAKRAASKLTNAFQQVDDWTTIGQQRSGRLDQRQVKAIGQTLERDGDLNALRPYQRSQPVPARQPLVVIVTSGGFGEMWADEKYIPRALTLTLAVQWACEAVGVQARSFFALEHIRIGKNYKYRHVQAAIEIADSRARTPLPVYLTALHRDLYRYGFMTVCAAEKEGYAELARVRGSSPSRNIVGHEYSAANGGRAVDWARQTLQPDMVISIGRNTDAQRADVTLNSKFTVQEAVSSIAEQLKPRR